MSRFIPPAERIILARKLIQKAREYPVLTKLGKRDLTYNARVENLLKKARSLVKFVLESPSATAEMKKEAEKVKDEIEQAHRELLP